MTMVIMDRCFLYHCLFNQTVCMTLFSPEGCNYCICQCCLEKCTTTVLERNQKISITNMKFINCPADGCAKVYVLMKSFPKPCPSDIDLRFGGVKSIFLLSGCRHMVCRCGIKFCYNCGKMGCASSCCKRQKRNDVYAELQNA
ncbi:hypothetical protein BDA99DRAFT_541419 [Phascolomyces articulosus]|uniref:Uncharacterized protein n=1 Tax=Phascolomyces articulosus TaxID=60185 RepID=A0AAD5JRR5_9FUNG|nr:hypothetical protein BDA99DRAFT_541419 [Phascolomyces articulosus]